jgi:hypothetical protein
MAVLHVRKICSMRTFDGAIQALTLARRSVYLGSSSAHEKIHHAANTLLIQTDIVIADIHTSAMTLLYLIFKV